MAVEVLIVGAGASGLTVANDLQRRGVSFRLIDAATGGFSGSRAKGVQPRTLEVFDDLGVLPALEPRSMLYPPLGVHLGPLRLRRTMIKLHRVTDDIPYPNTLLAPQYATDASLRERLEAIGGCVEYSTRLESYQQEADGVTAVIEGPRGREEIRVQYLIGADGGSSTVRKAAGISFVGNTDESDQMIVADLILTGLSRDRWHIWPRNAGRFMALCPLPGDKFQLMLKLGQNEPTNLSPAAIEQIIGEFTSRVKIHVTDILWSSVWRPNIRLAQHYRDRRILLVGDAAHVHPPAGGQGLNTGVQDAYNLAWKLAQVLAGAPDALLDTYEAERQPIAAGVLRLSTDLYAKWSNTSFASTKRGDEERQLTLSYRGGPLAASHATTDGSVVAGDRAPNAPIHTTADTSTTLFDAFRGPHFTLIAMGENAIAASKEVAWPTAGAQLHHLALSDNNDTFRATYKITGDALLLIRPDGYVARVTHTVDTGQLVTGLAPMLPPT